MLKIGAVVQPVRISACHAEGRGFESRPHRKKLQEIGAFFVYERFFSKKISACHAEGRVLPKHLGSAPSIKTKRLFQKSSIVSS